jgi:hypothetical protein
MKPSVAPIVAYCTVEHLTRGPGHQMDGEGAYLSMDIFFQADIQDAHTKKQIVQPPLPYQQALNWFNDCTREWEMSATRKQLREVLSSVIIPHGIQKIVAFACASIASTDRLFREAAAYQHALMLTLREFLIGSGSCSSSDLRCYAQEPSYVDADKQILKSVEVTVLEDPRGFLEVDETSIVISRSPNVPVRQIVTDITRPAMMIWDKVSQPAVDSRILT